MRSLRVHTEHGQALTLFALALVALLLAAGLVVDVGYAFAQQRTAQNAADFAAMAGARVLGEYYTGQPSGAGTDANVRAAVAAALQANNAGLGSAGYVDASGKALGNVGSGIPSGALGVVVHANASWHPFFLGVMGVTSWTASAAATAVTQGATSAGVMPVGISSATLDTLANCPSSSMATCALEPGTVIQPGQFGWLKFGAQGKCTLSGTPFGLGMSTTSGCGNSQTFLDSEIGPPPNSYGCCTTVTNDPSPYIGGLTGNEWGDLSYYIQNQIPVWVPVWDTSTATGAGSYYHIVGFAEILFTGDNEHAKNLTGVLVSGQGSTPNAQPIPATGAVTLVH
jgi:hypothetical protein